MDSNIVQLHGNSVVAEQYKNKYGNIFFFLFLILDTEPDLCKL